MSNCYLPSVVQGTDWTRVITWDDSTGAAVNVTGYSARLQFRNGSALLLELNSTSGGIVVGTTAGTFTLSMTHAQTAALPVGCFDYDLIVTSPAGTTSRLVTGALAVLPPVTHS